MLVTVILFFIIFLFINIYWKKLKSKEAHLKPPELSGKIPLLGHVLHLLGDSLHCWNVAKWMSEDCLQKGGVVTVSTGTREIYLIADPDDCAAVANQCTEKIEYYNFSRPWLGEGLFTASDKVWKKHRKLLNPSFSPQVINKFVGVFNSQARMLVRDFENVVNKGIFDHFPYLRSRELEITFYTVLGNQSYVKDSITDEYLQSVQEIQNILTQRFQKFWLHTDFIFNRTYYKKRQDELVEILHRMSNNVLQKRKSELDTRSKSLDQSHECKGKFKPFLDLLLELGSKDGLLSDKEVRDEVDGIIIAAHDTSAHVLVFIFTMLGSYPEVQERAYREIQEVWEDSDRDLDKDDVCKLVYLEAIIKETLRLYPAGPVIGRHAEVDVKLKNYTIPRNTSILLLYWGLHNHKIWGPDAAEFRPERWLDPATLPENPNAFAGFSIGKRNCIGKGYAMLSMKILLSHVIRRYRITADCSKIKLKIEVILKAAYGHEISLQLR